MMIDDTRGCSQLIKFYLMSHEILRTERPIESKKFIAVNFSLVLKIESRITGCGEFHC
jgi:hypothetical protein